MLTLLVDLDAADAHPELNRVIELARVFKANGRSFTLLSAQVSPDLLFMLHQVGLDTVPVVRLYDRLLNIHDTFGTPLQLSEVPTPKNWRPINGWPNVNYFDGQRLARTVTLHPLGFVWQITDYEASGGRQVAQYDDRGNRLYVDYREKGNGLVKREWFDDQANLVMTQDRQGAVMIAPAARTRFVATDYPDLAAVVAEGLDQWAMQEKRAPDLVASLTPLNLTIRRQLMLFPQVVFLAQAETRLSAEAALSVQSADQVVLPSKEDRRLFLAQFQGAQAKAWAPRVHAILPYPTTLALGHSNEAPNMTTYWFVGDVSEPEFRQTLEQVLTMLQKSRVKTVLVECDNQARVVSAQNILEQFLKTHFGVDLQSEEYQRVADYLMKQQANQLTAAERKQGPTLRAGKVFVPSSGAFGLQQRVVLKGPLPPEAQEAAMSTARIYLDTSRLTNLRLQMLAISNAIPQVVRRANDFIRPKETGIVVSGADQVVPALNYFLTTLHHWNTAQVGNATLLEANTAPHIMNEWKELI